MDTLSNVLIGGYGTFLKVLKQGKQRGAELKEKKEKIKKSDLPEGYLEIWNLDITVWSLVIIISILLLFLLLSSFYIVIFGIAFIMTFFDDNITREKNIWMRLIYILVATVLAPIYIPNFIVTQVFTEKNKENLVKFMKKLKH